MTSMMTTARQTHNMFATFVPVELFAEFYADLCENEPGLVFDTDGKHFGISELPYKFVIRSTPSTLRDGIRGYYAYVLFGREFFLTNHLGSGYQYVELDEVWQRDVIPIESIGADVLAEIL